MAKFLIHYRDDFEKCKDLLDAYRNSTEYDSTNLIIAVDENYSHEIRRLLDNADISFYEI